MSRASILIDWEGEVWRFTRRQWEMFCREGAEPDGAPDPRAAGAVLVGTIDHRPLDWRASDYRRQLDPNGDTQ